MPRIVPYSSVLEAMTAGGLISLYHNSGAFGFPRGTATLTVGWLGPPDGSLRPQGRAVARQVEPPFADNLAQGVSKFWQATAAGRAWVMPKSHWAYELEFGSQDWMPETLASLGIDSRELIARNTGDAIEFEASEAKAFQRFIVALLTHLHQSDFALAWPNLALATTVHSHQQIWWTTIDATILALIDQIVPDQAV